MAIVTFRDVEILVVFQMREITKAQVTAIVTWVLIAHRPTISSHSAGFIQINKI